MVVRAGVDTLLSPVSRRSSANIRTVATASRSACRRVAVSAPTQVQSAPTAIESATSPDRVMANIRRVIAREECNPCTNYRSIGNKEVQEIAYGIYGTNRGTSVKCRHTSEGTFYPPNRALLSRRGRHGEVRELTCDLRLRLSIPVGRHQNTQVEIGGLVSQPDN